jgi:hypothetical protein
MRRNLFQFWDGGRRPRVMYFETVDCATSKPSSNSSPWIRDAPYSGFSWVIHRIRSRRPRSILGRPTLFLDLQRQCVLKPARCHRSTVSGWTIRTTSSRLGQSRIIQAMKARSLPCSRTRGGAYRNCEVQLMRRSKNLGFEPSARLHEVAYKQSKGVKNREHLPSRCDDSAKTGESTPDGLFGKHARFSLARRKINCSTSRLIRGLPGPRRTFEPSNLRATSLRYQARMVSGRATVAPSARTRRPRR